MEEEMPQEYLNRLRSLSQRCFDSLVVGRREDLARLSFKNTELEEQVKQTKEQLAMYARFFASQGCDPALLGGLGGPGASAADDQED
ncbi:hypothetical protein PM082_023249 [Marasmius tenuissimus]|nr:hypothetical protein PM082_023249 [Marasmius tenuissimus]